ncbi:MAG: glycosyltransferase family 2 protein [Candidatus Margulisiibacteriota bacterium]|nr:glycosyltransferase family 2 protein [Candidatus Margulisiibacteriota bacterium]
MKFSCFFPMYNEEGNIRKMVSVAVAVLEKKCEEFEVIVVNDGSADKTKEIAEELSRNDNRIRVVNHEKNLGYGAALRSGLATCKYEIIFQSDGDNQYDLNEIDRLLPYINDHDFVIGYRIKRRDPFFRSLEALWYRFMLILLFGLNLRDTNCAFKIFKKSIISKLDLVSNGAIINGEIMIKARKNGYSKIKEVGVDHFPRKVGKQTGAKPRVLFEALISILKLWYNTTGTGQKGRKKTR